MSRITRRWTSSLRYVIACREGLGYWDDEPQELQDFYAAQVAHARRVLAALDAER